MCGSSSPPTRGPRPDRDLAMTERVASLEAFAALAPASRYRYDVALLAPRRRR